jgi:hypothetical protein
MGRFSHAPAAASRGLDRDDVAGGQLSRCLRRQLLAVDEIPAHAAGPAALEPLRRVAPAVSEQRERRRLEHPDRADEAVAAAVAALAAGAVEQLVALDPQRRVELERLDRRVQRVRHSDVDTRRPVAAAGGALAAAERLVVRPARRPDHEVVHRPLSLRGDIGRLREREQHGVGNALARLDIAGDDGAGMPRVHEASLRRPDLDRTKEAVVDRNVGAERDLDGEGAGGARDGEGRVHVPGRGRRSAVEVDLDPVVRDGHGNADRQVHVRLDLALGLVAAVR